MSSPRALTSLAARKTLVKEKTFDPLGLHDYDGSLGYLENRPLKRDHIIGRRCIKPAAAVSAAVASTALVPFSANAANSVISTGSMDPTKFNPVCPASDGVYRFLQTTTTAVVGDENFVEYGPLISGGLLRIRLELCVIESFFKEAIGPFIKQNGISWILPFHETVETFLAGVIFALATTFILIGSTKLVTVILVYVDLLFGAPARLFGGFAFDRALGKPVTLDLGFGPFKRRVIGPPDDADSSSGEAADVGKELKDFADNLSPVGAVVLVLSGAAKYAGQGVGLMREILEAIDFFVGRYLVVGATGYILLKFVHFKVFPDFP